MTNNWTDFCFVHGLELLLKTEKNSVVISLSIYLSCCSIKVDDVDV